LISGGQVRAGEEACTDPAYPYCYDYTIVNQWACETCPGTQDWRCTHNTNVHCENGEGGGNDSICTAYDPNSRCYQVCIYNGTVWTGSCSVLQKNVQCNTSQGYCSWTGQLTNCLWRDHNTKCSEPSQTETKSCCGCPNPPCNGSGGSPTPSPTLPPPCTATNPTKAVLVSPANGSTVTGSSGYLALAGAKRLGNGLSEPNGGEFAQQQQQLFLHPKAVGLVAGGG